MVTIKPVWNRTFYRMKNLSTSLRKRKLYGRKKQHIYSNFLSLCWHSEKWESKILFFSFGILALNFILFLLTCRFLTSRYDSGKQNWINPFILKDTSITNPTHIHPLPQDFLLQQPVKGQDSVSKCVIFEHEVY